MRKLTVLTCSCILALVTLLAVGCSSGSATIKVASKDFTEQYILGEMLKAVVEGNTDLKVDLTSGIAGETSIIHPAMVKGDFDLYPEYDSTAWMTVLKKPKTYDTETMHAEMDRIYAGDFSLDWLGFYGFDNTYGLTVRKETADKYGLETYSDLAKCSSELIFGAGYEFYEREDGYKDLQALYGFQFADTLEMNLGLKYEALQSGQVDVITIYKTDGRMDNPDLVELVDDLDYFPPALCGTIIRQETASEHPELVSALELLNGAITNEDMRKMNAQVDMEGKDARDVAVAFLQEKGLI